MSACHFAEQVSAQAAEEAAATRSVIETAVGANKGLAVGSGLQRCPA